MATKDKLSAKERSELRDACKHMNLHFGAMAAIPLEARKVIKVYKEFKARK